MLGATFAGAQEVKVFPWNNNYYGYGNLQEEDSLYFSHLDLFTLTPPFRFVKMRTALSENLIYRSNLTYYAMDNLYSKKHNSLYLSIYNHAQSLDYFLGKLNLSLDNMIVMKPISTDISVLAVDKTIEINDRFYFVGVMDSVINGVIQQQERKNFFIKMDKDLQVEFAYSFGGFGLNSIVELFEHEQKLYALSIVLNTPSNPGIGSGLSDICVSKIDTLGNILWTKTYGTPNGETINFNKRDNYAQVINNHIYIIFYGALFNGASNYIMKLDLDGNLLATKAIKSPQLSNYLFPRSANKYLNNQLLCTFDSYDDNWLRNGVLMLFDENLNVTLAKLVGTPSGEPHILNSVEVFKDGSIVATSSQSTHFGGDLLFYTDKYLNTGCLEMGPIDVVLEDYPMQTLSYTLTPTYHTGFSYDTIQLTVDTLYLSDGCYCNGPLEQTTAGLTQQICKGGWAEIGELMAPGSLQYEWSPTTGLETPTEGYTLAMPEQTTTYTLTVTDTNGLNCERKLVHTVTVEVLDCNTGSIGVWPNPNNGTFTLDHQTAFGQPNTRVKYTMCGAGWCTTNH
jgi:hypothetical protein